MAVAHLAESNLQVNCLHADWMHVSLNVRVIVVDDWVVVVRSRLELSLQVDCLGE